MLVASVAFSSCVFSHNFLHMCGHPIFHPNVTLLKRLFAKICYRLNFQMTQKQTTLIQTLILFNFFSNFHFIWSHFLRKNIFRKLSHIKVAFASNAFKKGVRMALKGHFGSLEIMVRFTSSIGTKFGLTPTQNVHLSQNNRVV